MATTKTEEKIFLEAAIRQTVGKGPAGELMRVQARPNHMIEELKQKFKWASRIINQGEYPRTPMQPFDSPCGMCEYRTHCIEGKDSDLIFAASDKAA